MKRITEDLQGVCGVYKIINLVNGKFYIGSSKNIRVRLWTHRAELRHDHHDNIHLQNAWNKYGENNFDYCVLETCDEERQFEREQYYIDTLNPDYNIAKIVELPSYTEESRKKLSSTRKRLFAEGKLTASNERKVFMYDLKGNFIREFESVNEAIRQTGIYKSLVQKNLSGENKRCHEYMFRYYYSPQIEAYKRTKKVDNQYKAIHVYNDNEEYYFKNAEECSKYFGCHIVSVRGAILHNRHFMYKYKIEYKTARQ